MQGLSDILNLDIPPDAPRLAVAVSGGADSMALAHMLSLVHPDVHALTVDHGLRAESAIEAAQVGAWLSSFSGLRHTVLRWNGEKPDTGMMENARAARYALMADYCRANDIGYLALAHHRDDQAETFLMRLTHGSGIDGLAAMRRLHAYNDALMIWRPLLAAASHDDLKNYCRDAGVPWIEDPTNTDRKYKRNRLRAAREMLDAEGLSPKRLATTAQRMERASDALRILADRLLETSMRERDENAWVLDRAALRAEPFELAVRVLRTAIDTLGASGDHGARFEKIESLAQNMLAAEGADAWTLGGCVVRVDARGDTLRVSTENPLKSAKTLPLAANGL